MDYEQFGFEPSNEARLMYRKMNVWTALLLASSLLATACNETVTNQECTAADSALCSAQTLNTKVFVSPLEALELRDDGALVLDTRSREKYDAGHINGAVYTLGGKEFQDELGLVIPDIISITETARLLGMHNDQKIVVYGDTISSNTARLFWTLEYLGHGDVYFVAEGFEEILVETSEVASTQETIPPKGDFVVALRSEIFASAEEVRQAATGEKPAILIDTRRESEWLGDEDRGDPRQGAIPNATWYYWENVYDANTGKLRPKAELKAEFEALGLFKPDSVIIPYCQTGVRSAVVYAVFRWLGHDNVKNFDGSWSEWSRDNNLPIVDNEPEVTE